MCMYVLAEARTTIPGGVTLGEATLRERPRDTATPGGATPDEATLKERP